MSRERNLTSRKTSGIAGFLDIGSSKIACMIAALGPDAGRGEMTETRVVGLGHTRARGIKAGVVTDFEQAESAMRAAIGHAERMCGVRLEDVCMSISGGRLQSKTFAANADIGGGVVRPDDVSRLMAGGRAYAEREGRTLVQMNRIGYRLDGHQGAKDPTGMAARRLSADLHAVTVDEMPLHNLLLLVERCYLGVSSVMAAPYASALATLSEDEQRLGATVVDIGGGTTSIAMFADSRFIHVDAIPIGGNHVSFDIARCLQTPLAEAERIKALYGTLVGAQSDAHEVFSYPYAGESEDHMQQATKAELAGIVRPRVVAQLKQVAERIGKSGWADHAGRRIVLTGGGAQLAGIGEFAADVLRRPVRIASPVQVSGVPPGVSGAAFSTLIGLLIGRVAAHGELVAYKDHEVLEHGYFGRVGQWLMESL